MFKQYNPQTARRTILKRTPPDEFPVSQRVLDSIEKLFGEALTPEQAVTRILKDVRTNGDSALRNWTQRLDSFDLQPAPVSKALIQSALDSISPEQRAALEQADPNKPPAQGQSPNAPRRRPRAHEDDDVWEGDRP